MPDSNVWKLTSAARTALLDGQNRGVRAVAMTSIAVGDGSGVPTPAATTSRNTLRNQRDSAAAEGATAVSGRIAVRASIVPGATYDVTEVGLFAQIENDPEFLFAYWTDGGRVLAAASADATTVVAGVVDVAGAAADVTVTLSPTVVLSNVAALVDLNDVPDALVAGNYLRAVSPGAGSMENVPPATILHDLLSGLGLAAGDVTRVRETGGTLSLEGARVGFRVQRGIVTQPNGNIDGQVDVTINAVVAERTWARATQVSGAPSAAGAQLVNSTTLRVHGRDGGTFTYQVIESD